MTTPKPTPAPWHPTPEQVAKVARVRHAYREQIAAAAKQQADLRRVLIPSRRPA